MSEATTHVVQVWILPAPAGGQIETTGERPIRLRIVTAKPPNAPEFRALLLEVEATSDMVSQGGYSEFSRLAQCVSRMSFTLLTRFEVFSARIVPKGQKVGDTVSYIAFPGPPPGFALHESRVGYPKTLGFNPSFLEGDVDAQAQQAITWFLRGYFGSNPIEQVLGYWIGLELLTPDIKTPFRCRHCDTELRSCPGCGASTDEFRVRQSIQRYLCCELGADKKEVDSLYEVRCTLAHGHRDFTTETMSRVGKQVFRLQDLLLSAIKHKLGWPPDAPPIIHPKGATIIGSPGLGFSDVRIESDDFYDQPGVYPG